LGAVLRGEQVTCVPKTLVERVSGVTAPKWRKTLPLTILIGRRGRERHPRVRRGRR
jgi:hypothetical protein